MRGDRLELPACPLDARGERRAQPSVRHHRSANRRAAPVPHPGEHPAGHARVGGRSPGGAWRTGRPPPSERRSCSNGSGAGRAEVHPITAEGSAECDRAPSACRGWSGSARQRGRIAALTSVTGASGGRRCLGGPAAAARAGQRAGSGGVSPPRTAPAARRPRPCSPPGPAALAPIACISGKFSKSSCCATRWTTRAAIGKALIPAAPMSGLNVPPETALMPFANTIPAADVQRERQDARGRGSPGCWAGGTSRPPSWSRWRAPGTASRRSRSRSRTRGSGAPRPGTRA